MKKFIYTALTVLAAAGGIGLVASADSADSAVLFGGAGVDYTTLKPDYPSVNYAKVFDVANGTCAINFEITPPTQGRDANWDYYDMVEFSKLVLTRSLGYNGEPVVLKEWENVKAGDILKYTDTDASLQMGEKYTYEVTAYNGDIMGSGESEYVLVGVEPVSPDAPVVTLGEKGAGPAVIKFTCPALVEGNSWNPKPMPEGVTYTKLELYRQDGNYSTGFTVVPVETIENPEPGKEYTAKDENPNMNAQNVYCVRTFTAFGNSDDGYCYVWVGEDCPGRPKKVEANELQDGTVLVKWDAVTEGANDGYFDTASVKYKVWRLKSSYDNEPLLLSGDCAETTYIDKLEGVESEIEVYYRVEAYNHVESTSSYNYTTTYEGLTVGPAAKLPFRETFNTGVKMNKGYDNNMKFTYDYKINSGMVTHSETFKVNGEDFTVIAGVDGGDPESDAGCDNYFIIKPSPWYAEDEAKGTLSSPGIDLSNVSNPYVSLSYVSVAGSSAKITIEVTDNSIDENNEVVWTNVGSFYADDNYKEEPETPAEAVAAYADEPQESLWKSKRFSLSQFSGKGKVKMRVNVEYPGRPAGEGKLPTLLDNLFVEDFPGVTGLAVAAEENGDLKLTWALPESSGNPEGVKYNVYNGETLLGTVEATEYVFKGAEQGDTYSFSVEAVYSNGLVTEKCAPVEYAVPVTEFTVGDYQYTVGGEKAIAAKYVGETDSTVLPAEVEYKGVKYTVEVSDALYKGNRVLKNLEIQAAIEVIPAEFCYGAIALESVKLPAVLEKIGDKAFFGNVVLKVIEFPESLKEIGAGAFQNCEALAEVHFATATPPTVGADAFAGIANPCKGYCPEGAEDTYAAVENLKPITFKEDGVGTIGVEGAVSVEYYNLSGARVAEPVEGEPAIARYKMADGTVKTVKIIKNRK